MASSIFFILRVVGFFRDPPNAASVGVAVIFRWPVTESHVPLPVRDAVVGPDVSEDSPVTWGRTADDLMPVARDPAGPAGVSGVVEYGGGQNVPPRACCLGGVHCNHGSILLAECQTHIPRGVPPIGRASARE